MSTFERFTKETFLAKWKSKCGGWSVGQSWFGPKTCETLCENKAQLLEIIELCVTSMGMPTRTPTTSNSDSQGSGPSQPRRPKPGRRTPFVRENDLKKEKSDKAKSTQLQPVVPESSGDGAFDRDKWELPTPDAFPLNFENFMSFWQETWLVAHWFDCHV